MDAADVAALGLDTTFEVTRTGVTTPKVSRRGSVAGRGEYGFEDGAGTGVVVGGVIQAVSVSWSTANGSAVAPGDYASGLGSVSFAPGETAKTVALLVNGDTVDELDETLSLALSNAVNATISPVNGSATVTITDDDLPPVLSASAVSVVEGNAGSKTVQVTVSLSAASSKNVSVSWSTVNGSALAPGDYAAAIGTVTFAPGETTKTVAVSVNGDTLDESDETLSVALSNAVNATISPMNGSGTVTINDDDPPPTPVTPPVAPTPPTPATPPAQPTPPTPPAPPVVAAPTPPASAPAGYWMLGQGGAVYGFGAAAHYGNAATSTAVDLEPTPSGDGYWIVNSAGQVFAHGNAPWLGNATGLANGESVASISSTKSGAGYWLFTNRGRVLNFGDAPHYGDMSGTTLNGPVLGSIPTTSGNGYYMVASDGGIFAFGDAQFYGSMGGQRLNAPVMGLVPDADGVGYWLVASDGGIFAFNAPFRGSMGAARLNKPVIGMVRYGDGYLMVGSDGGIFTFSDQPFLGSLGANPPAMPIAAVATR